MAKSEELFWKLARPDGYDFYTGMTINYRDNIGGEVVCPKFNRDGELCSSAFIYASRELNQCFVGVWLPCSVFLVEGSPIIEEVNKCGFEKLSVLEELNPGEVFGWRYEEACNPLYPFKIKPPTKITKRHIELLKEWANAMGNICNVWNNVMNSDWNRVWFSIKNKISIRWSCVWDNVKNDAGECCVAYIGYIFAPVIEEWKEKYPFQCVVDILKEGLVPSFDGKMWRLYGGNEGTILWEGELND